MDKTYGIAIYDPNFKFDKENSIEELRRRYIEM